MVRGDRVILTDIEHKAISNKDGNAIAISGPLTAPGVQVLEELRPELLQVWGIRFGDEVDVVFNAKTTANLDATLLQQAALSFFAPSVMPWALRGHLVMSPN